MAKKTGYADSEPAEITLTFKQPVCGKPAITIAPSTGSTAEAGTGDDAGKYLVRDGSAFDFSVTSPETGVTYTWYKGSTATADIGAFTPPTRTPYKTDTDELPAELSYICVASKPGYADAVSDAVTLKLVKAPPYATIGTTAYYTKDELVAAIGEKSGSITITLTAQVTSTKDLRHYLGDDNDDSNTIGYAIKDNSLLTSVSVDMSATSLTGLDAFTFKDCISLVSVTLPSSLETIESYAFQDCTSLTSVRIPASVTSIGSYAFDGCPLTSATFENPNGWKIGPYGSFSPSPDNLNNPATAADWLKSDYRDLDWTRE